MELRNLIASCIGDRPFFKCLKNLKPDLGQYKLRGGGIQMQTFISTIGTHKNQKQPVITQPKQSVTDQMIEETERVLRSYIDTHFKIKDLEQTILLEEQTIQYKKNNLQKQIKAIEEESKKNIQIGKEMVVSEKTLNLKDKLIKLKEGIGFLECGVEEQELLEKEGYTAKGSKELIKATKELIGTSKGKLVELEKEKVKIEQKAKELIQSGKDKVQDLKELNTKDMIIKLSEGIGNLEEGVKLQEFMDNEKKETINKIKDLIKTSKESLVELKLVEQKEKVFFTKVVHSVIGKTPPSELEKVEEFHSKYLAKGAISSGPKLNSFGPFIELCGGIPKMNFSGFKAICSVKPLADVVQLPTCTIKTLVFPKITSEEDQLILKKVVDLRKGDLLVKYV